MDLTWSTHADSRPGSLFPAAQRLMPWGKRDGNNWCLANHAASSTKKYHWLGRYTVCLNTFMYIYIYIMLRHLLILHLSHAIYLLIFLICNIIIYIYIICIEVEVVSKADTPHLEIPVCGFLCSLVKWWLDVGRSKMGCTRKWFLCNGENTGKWCEKIGIGGANPWMSKV